MSAGKFQPEDFFGDTPPSNEEHNRRLVELRAQHLEGVRISEEEVAKELGFSSVTEFREWQNKKDTP